jgi:hypothetical protein
VWKHCEPQTFWSSPTVGLINSTGRPAVVIGTSWNTNYYRPATSDLVYAFYADNGSVVPGWPVRTSGATFGSPAIGDIEGNGSPAVVDTSCAHCANGPAEVNAWSGSGRHLWSRVLNAHEELASPILVDLTGSGANDVVVGNTWGLYLLDGRTGNFLYGTGAYPLGKPCSVQNSALVTYVPSHGWRLYEACGGPLYAGKVLAWPLPVAPAVPPAWPEWRGDGTRDGAEADPTVANVVRCPDSPGRIGYRVVSAAGGVVPFGSAPYCGSLAGKNVSSPAVGIASTPDGNGYWLATADGGVYAFGTARLYPGEDGQPALGSLQGEPLSGPIVGIVSSVDGKGYSLVGADGSVYSFGDAVSYGSLAGKSLRSPIVGMALDPATGGYWLAAADGAVSSFGPARLHGSAVSLHLNGTIIGIAADAATGGYWLASSGGGVFAYDARFHGSMAGARLGAPISGIAADSATSGYWLVGADGGIFSFDAKYMGSGGHGQLETKVTGLAPA